MDMIVQSFLNFKLMVVDKGLTNWLSYKHFTADTTSSSSVLYSDNFDNINWNISLDSNPVSPHKNMKTLG